MHAGETKRRRCIAVLALAPTGPILFYLGSAIKVVALGLQNVKHAQVALCKQEDGRIGRPLPKRHARQAVLQRAHAWVCEHAAYA